jgi:hypothetical protein
LCKIGSPLLSFLLCSLCTPLQGKENSNYFLSADCDFCIFGKDCCAGGCDILYGQQDCK